MFDKTTKEALFWVAGGWVFAMALFAIAPDVRGNSAGLLTAIVYLLMWASSANARRADRAAEKKGGYPWSLDE